MYIYMCVCLFCFLFFVQSKCIEWNEIYLLFVLRRVYWKRTKWKMKIKVGRNNMKFMHIEEVFTCHLHNNWEKEELCVTMTIALLLHTQCTRIGIQNVYTYFVFVFVIALKMKVASIKCCCVCKQKGIRNNSNSNNTNWWMQCWVELYCAIVCWSNKCVDEQV